MSLQEQIANPPLPVSMFLVIMPDPVKKTVQLWPRDVQRIPREYLSHCSVDNSLRAAVLSVLYSHVCPLWSSVCSRVVSIISAVKKFLAIS